MIFNISPVALLALIFFVIKLISFRACGVVLGVRDGTDDCACVELDDVGTGANDIAIG